MSNSSSAELSTPEIIKVTKAEITKNRKLHTSNKVDDQMIAVDYLSKVMDGLRQKLGRMPYRNEILHEMKRIGFDISKSTLWRYRGKIKKVRTAVRDLLEEGTYSAYFDHNMELLDDIEEYALKEFTKTWTNSKTVDRQAYDKDSGVVELQDVHTTEEIAAPKASFLNILTKVVDLRRSALNDENINLASAMLSEDFQELKEKYQESERKYDEIEKELKSVLKRKSSKGNDTSTA